MAKIRSILIVDDVVDNLVSIVNYFEEEDVPYDIMQAVNGKLAYEIAVTEIPDLIITDWEMPEMNGIDLIKALKKNETTANIPVIMCSGIMISSENLKMALEVGAADYIRKPIDKVELLARTHSILRLADSYKKIRELNKSVLSQRNEIQQKNEALNKANNELKTVLEKIKEQKSEL